jgi:hypothetical protein
LMTSRGGAEGYVFVATRVIPAEGKVEARGRPGRGKKQGQQGQDIGKDDGTSETNVAYIAEDGNGDHDALVVHHEGYADEDADESPSKKRRIDAGDEVNLKIETEPEKQSAIGEQEKMKMEDDKTPLSKTADMILKQEESSDLEMIVDG